MVFGERQEAFLLPWKRVCGYSNESLIVAKRDQAKALFQNHMNALGEGLPVRLSVCLPLLSCQGVQLQSCHCGQACHAKAIFRNRADHAGAGLAEQNTLEVQ